MEEVLYNIEIHKDEDRYLGKIYSDIDGMKEFENQKIYDLLRDITFDIELALEEFSSRSEDILEPQEEVK
ncbi:MAG: hypothetical protein NT038_04205 [Euryarchaeota archaeon]|nr:hypothetical protein [Euryarchaeota archaeon]